MLSACGQSVGSLRITVGRTRVRMSPVCAYDAVARKLARVQLHVLRKLSVSFTPYISPPKIAVSPLIEHYFYPVSTAPIIKPHQIN